MVNYNYYLGPLQWVTENGASFWRAPVGTVGLIDLGKQSDFILPGFDRNILFLAMDGTLDSSYIHLAGGDLREINVDALMLSKWTAALGYTPNGTLLSDILFDHLTNGSDADWTISCKPLIPTRYGILELWLGGHSLIHSERFIFGSHTHTEKVRSILMNNFRAQYDLNIEYSRKFLGSLLLKYGLPESEWKQLVPLDLQKEIPGPLKPETTITESFDTADSDTLGPDLTWTEVSGNDFEIISNKAEDKIPNAFVSARADSDLSSDDHSATADVTWESESGAAGGGTSVRFSASENTHYMCVGSAFDDADQIWKVIAGEVTGLAGQGHTIGAETLNVFTQADGSTISVKVGAASTLSFTDTSITGNTRTGISGFSTASPTDNHKWDNFQATDLPKIIRRSLNQIFDSSIFNSRRIFKRV